MPCPRATVQANVWRATCVVKGKGQLKAKPITFQELIILLIGSNLHLVFVAFQYLLRDGEGWE